MFNKVFSIMFLLTICINGETVSDILLEGIIEGLQLTPSSPSACVQSYSSVSSSYTTVIDTFDIIGINTIFDFLNNFNNFVNQFVASYDLCNYSSIAAKYFTDGQTALLNFLINFFANISKIFENFSNLKTYELSNDYLNQGICIGKIIRYSTGISL